MARILMAGSLNNPNVITGTWLPVNHGAKIRIHFFSLRQERSALYNPHFCIFWQPIVDDHMAKKSKRTLILKENSFEWDSGFSDG